MARARRGRSNLNPSLDKLTKAGARRGRLVLDPCTRSIMIMGTSRVFKCKRIILNNTHLFKASAQQNTSENNTPEQTQNREPAIKKIANNDIDDILKKNMTRSVLRILCNVKAKAPTVASNIQRRNKNMKMTAVKVAVVGVRIKKISDDDNKKVVVGLRTRTSIICSAKSTL